MKDLNLYETKLAELNFVHKYFIHLRYRGRLYLTVTKRADYDVMIVI
jgi:hypothetical protein